MVLNVNDLVKFDLSKYKMILDNQKKQQNEKDLSENKNPFGTMNFISLNNKDANKAQIQELAKIVSQAKVKENKESIIDKNHTQKVLLKRNHYIPIASFWGIED